MSSGGNVQESEVVNNLNNNIIFNSAFNQNVNMGDNNTEHIEYV